MHWEECVHTAVVALPTYSDQAINNVIGGRAGGGGGGAVLKNVTIQCWAHGTKVILYQCFTQSISISDFYLIYLLIFNLESLRIPLKKTYSCRHKVKTCTGSVSCQFPTVQVVHLSYRDSLVLRMTGEMFAQPPWESWMVPCPCTQASLYAASAAGRNQERSLVPDIPRPSQPPWWYLDETQVITITSMTQRSRHIPLSLWPGYGNKNDAEGPIKQKRESSKSLACKATLLWASPG